MQRQYFFFSFFSKKIFIDFNKIVKWQREICETYLTQNIYTSSYTVIKQKKITLILKNFRLINREKEEQLNRNIENNLTQGDELTRRKSLIICTFYCYWERVSIMSTSTKRRNVVSRTSFITSRMNLHSRKMQMQDDIEKLLSDKFSETISDSTALRLFRAVTQLLSLLFTREKNMRQKLININKKLERIESNIFKTKTNIEIYAIAIKIESLTDFDVTTTARRNLDVSTTQQKTFTEIRRKKTMMIKINNEAKKTIIRIMIIKDLMQKLKTIEKKEKNILSIRRLLSDDLKLLARFEKTRERMKQDKKLLHDITSSTTAMRRTYVVLAHDVRMSNVNTFNQQTAINQIVKQNSSLHKDLNIVRIVRTKKTERLRKEHFSLIIELISFETTNRLIKDELLNDYSHRVCEYFEKKCRIKQCFRCQKYDHVNKICRNDEKCDFCASEHFSFECKTFNEHRKCVNCVDKHSAWSFQCDVKAKKKQRFDTI